MLNLRVKFAVVYVNSGCGVPAKRMFTLRNYAKWSLLTRHYEAFAANEQIPWLNRCFVYVCTPVVGSRQRHLEIRYCYRYHQSILVKNFS